MRGLFVHGVHVCAYWIVINDYWRLVELVIMSCFELTSRWVRKATEDKDE